MQNTATVYSQASSRRKNWLPISPTSAQTCTEGAEDTISRCLSLTDLEISVLNFINEGISKDEQHKITPEGVECLLRNVEDEEKHLEALTNCRKVFKDYKHYKEAEAICKVWESHPDFPITKAATLENAVFFVILPIYRQFGTVSLRTTAVDISADESIHAQTHRYAAMQVGHRPSKSLDNLRKQTVAWLLEGFNVKGFDKDTFIRASDNLMYRGVAPELNFTQTYQVHSFFEKANDDLPYYN